jgi:hypothetical protein
MLSAIDEVTNFALGKGASCMELKKDCHNMSGIYTLENNGASIDVFCDMETDGGGWAVSKHAVHGTCFRCFPRRFCKGERMALRTSTVDGTTT